MKTEYVKELEFITQCISDTFDMGQGKTNQDFGCMG